ncbi:ATP-binding protein [Parabacteroides sp. PF5-6]|uniref:sensor histidine kinase n=1 Tax=Parabacteroides sp. PF5-6 TaxID=1742403 RepID=UPI002406F612|nr:ATP-binding protein [Parabacteroides sp. PF5-6]MDF9831447.1 nitrogen fixation/metabolism regulation signal transduction histidine kinase [Parabacteroides sp. PF5-6]
MRSKWVFWAIVAFILLILIGVGFLFFRDKPFPFWVIQCIALLSFFFALFLYQKLIRPYHLLLSGMSLLKEQDFATHLRPVNNKDADQVIAVFNRMITHLRSERLVVREKNQFLDLLIKASPQGILLLNFDKQIADINPAGLKILGIEKLAEVKGKKLNEVSFALAPTLAALKPQDDMIVRGAGASVFRCVRSSFVDQGFDHPFIFIEELTQELLKIEKESYERIIRMMSHEVNNSVGAIGSTLNVVSDIFRQEGNGEWEDVLVAVDASYNRCGNLAHFIDNLSRVVRIPEPTLSSVSLNEQARAVEALTRMECQRRHIPVKLFLAEEDQEISVDGIQFEQVLFNILKNAYEAIGEYGEIHIRTLASPLSITVEDNGPGIDSEAREKLFTPFFTTKSTGQGIGLMFVRDVLINHRCRFSLTSCDGWTRFEILF